MKLSSATREKNNATASQDEDESVALLSADEYGTLLETFQHKAQDNPNEHF